MQFKNPVLIFLLFVVFGQTHGQSIIKGRTEFKTDLIDVYEVSDYVTNTEKKLLTVSVDSNGIFAFNLPVNSIKKIILRDKKHFSWMYVQPKSRYFIQLSNDGSTSSFLKDNEIEMEFFYLDSNDINYKILGFEAWMDSEIADLFVLKDAQQAEFIKRVRNFKNEVSIEYEQDTSIYFREYVKYSIGLNVDQIKFLGSPSINDKFSFYLDSMPILYRHDKYMEYMNLFFNRYYFSLNSESRKIIYDAVIRSDAKMFLNALHVDEYLKSTELTELVALKILHESLNTQEFPKSNAVSIIEQLEFMVSNEELKIIARNILNSYNQLKVGSRMKDFKLNASVYLNLYQGKYVYIHFFDPNNQKCLSEISALKKLNEKYGKYITFLTIYQTKKTGFSSIEQRNLDAIIWDKFALDPAHEIWTDLKINNFPYYQLLDKNLILLASP
ncbi:MAG: TlpA family protein disulfide reductase, partial [Bacteroidota bacterium]